MIFIGTFIRGPGWQWFWPGQTWDHNRLIYEVNRDLPDLFGITSNWGKGIFGAAVVGGFFALGGLLGPAFFPRHKPKNYNGLGLCHAPVHSTVFLTPIRFRIQILFPLSFP